MLPTDPEAVLRESLFSSIWNKFDLLSEFTATHSAGYRGNQWGIANKNRLFYGDSKVKFIFNQLMFAQREGRLPEKPVVCEVGFNAGHSAMLFLDALPNAILHEWDLGDMDYTAKNAALFSRIYARRFHYHRGDSAKTVPAFITSHPNHKCDVLFVDGCKGLHGRLYDVGLFAPLATPLTLLFGDEANTRECMSGEVDEHHPLCTMVHHTEWAWNRLVRSNALKWHNCSWPRRGQWNSKDLVCLWSYTRQALESYDPATLLTSTEIEQLTNKSDKWAGRCLL